jgi:nucleoside-diphosphate-sugar epimerase
MSSIIPPNSTVLVTGINGFIASHVADELLQAGYKVRGTTRTLQKGEFIRNLFAGKYGADRIEIVAVPNISIDGAFDDAVKGMSSTTTNSTYNLTILSPQAYQESPTSQP